MLYAAIAKVRPDFKVMANFLLSRIPNLKDAFSQSILSLKILSGKAALAV